MTCRYKFKKIRMALFYYQILQNNITLTLFTFIYLFIYFLITSLDI